MISPVTVMLYATSPLYLGQRQAEMQLILNDCLCSTKIMHIDLVDNDVRLKHISCDNGARMSATTSSGHM